MKAVDWKPPTNIKGVQEFLGFINFYRQFIENFNNIARPLYKLLGKDIVWNWSQEADKAFVRVMGSCDPMDIC